jgi:curved DNA-binding protein CbpA
MTIENDYYGTLGVLPSVDATVLTAVYRALLKKYHPDVYSGSKADAERITKEINEAYAILSVAAKRAEYDKRRGNAQERAGDYERENDRGPNRNGADSTLKDNWDLLVRYYPEAESFRLELSELSSTLALAYQVTLIESKSAARASALRAGLRQQFLERYFGSNKAVHDFVVSALHANRRDVAAEVNRAIKVLGAPTAEATQQFIETVRRVTRWNANDSTAPKSAAADRDASRSRANAAKAKAVDEFPVEWVIAIAAAVALVLAFIFANYRH